MRSVLLGLALALLIPTGALAAALHPKLLAKVGYGTESPGFARTADGTLHVVYETNISWGDSANGVGASSISPSGHLWPAVQALSWGTPTGGSPNGIPGLAVMPGGSLEATFGGSPTVDDGPWGISSTNGGASWTSPADIGSGTMEFGDSHVAIALSKTTPVLAAGCCGGIVIQSGFGTGSPTYLLTNTSNDAAGNTNLATDASTGAVVASWDSNAGSGNTWLQQVAPTVGAALKVPIPKQYGTGVPSIISGRDSGKGVYAAYPANFGNTTHIRLLRYGGGSVAVGSIKGLHAETWGTATGNDGRVWVFWAGFINGKGITVVTRSNKAVTRFEPLQTYRFNWTFLFTMGGDGRLGPLDMLLGGTPEVKSGPLVGGIYYARLLPVMSAHVSVTHLKGNKFRLKVTVTDAGDALKGATVSAQGAKKSTNGKGVAKLNVSGTPGSHVTVTVSDGGYKSLTQKVTL